MCNKGIYASVDALNPVGTPEQCCRNRDAEKICPDVCHGIIFHKHAKAVCPSCLIIQKCAGTHARKSRNGVSPGIVSQKQTPGHCTLLPCLKVADLHRKHGHRTVLQIIEIHANHEIHVTTNQNPRNPT